MPLLLPLIKVWQKKDLTCSVARALSWRFVLEMDLREMFVSLRQECCMSP